jgi:hypothetical protein
MMSEFNFEDFVDGYVLCALWSDCYPPDDDMDGEYGGKHDLDLREGARETMIEKGQLKEFVEMASDDLQLYCEQMGPWHGSDDRGYCEDSPEHRAGHDFWLTRQGHGTGFWDRGLGDLGGRLTEDAKSFGSADDHTPYDCGDDTADV